MVQVFVNNRNVDQALRLLIRKIHREGLLKEMRLRRAYEKPTEKRKRKRADARKRRDKYNRRSDQAW